MPGKTCVYMCTYMCTHAGHSRVECNRLLEFLMTQHSFPHSFSPKGLPWWLRGKESAFNPGDSGTIPGSGRCPGERNGHPLQYSCLENPTDRDAWWAKIHGGHKESDTAEQVTLSLFTHSIIIHDIPKAETLKVHNSAVFSLFTEL